MAHRRILSAKQNRIMRHNDLTLTIASTRSGQQATRTSQHATAFELNAQQANEISERKLIRAN